jgi:hypothetical protein
VRLEGLGQFINPMTSSGMEPATFRSVADQTLNNTKAGFDVLAAVVMNSSIFE